MLASETSAATECPYCGGTHIVRNGKNTGNRAKPDSGELLEFLVRYSPLTHKGLTSFYIIFLWFASASQFQYNFPLFFALSGDYSIRLSYFKREARCLASLQEFNIRYVLSVHLLYNLFLQVYIPLFFFLCQTKRSKLQLPLLLCQSPRRNDKSLPEKHPPYQ